MPVRKISFSPDCYYHIFNRGNRKEQIFFESTDYQRFLDKLLEYKQKYEFEVLAYCLMPNHFHLLVRQITLIPLSFSIGVLQNSYARFIGIKHELPTGHIFQGRFKAKLVNSETYLLQLSRYIHLNIVKDKILASDFTKKGKLKKLEAKMRDILRNYQWSSYKSYLNNQDSKIVDKELIESYYPKLGDYQEFVEAEISLFDIEELEGLTPGARPTPGVQQN